MDGSQDLKRTPLFETHVALGGRMVPFGGWDMPVQYGGILDEARAVRTHAGLFDVSHMGRVDIDGPGAGSFLSSIFSSDVTKLAVGRARYGVLCTQEGGIIDDCIVYRRGEQRFQLVPNASNMPDVLAWLSRWAPDEDDARIDDVTSRSAMIALQGPGAADILAELTPLDLSALRPFRGAEAEVGGVETFVARTGYTGENGFELIMPREGVVEAWSLLTNRGAKPCGLGARDVLRLEAGLLLHGNDMDVATNPYEAGLDRFVDPDREGYVAGDALRRIRDEGTDRVLVGFNVVGRGIARHEHPIMDGAKQIGLVTSGSHSPTLDRSIGLGYVPTEFSSPGTRFQIDVRGRLVEAEVAALPFYSRKRGE